MAGGMEEIGEGFRLESSSDFSRAVRPLIPALRARARRLTGNSDDSDDLVQDTLIRAWRGRGGFTPGTNLRAWLMRIERNSFLSSRRHGWPRVTLEPEVVDHQLSVPPTQEIDLYLNDLERAVALLPPEQREAYLLVQGGDRYEDIARRLGVPEGTLRSRIARARSALIRMMETGVRQSSPKPQCLIDPKPPSHYKEWKRSGATLIG